LRACAYDNRIVRTARPAVTGIGKPELRLPRTNQFNVNLGEYLGIEQCPVLCAARIVDAVSGAEVIETIRSRRVLAACQQQRIHEPLTRDQFALRTLKFSTQKRVIESGIMNHKWGIADEGKKIVHDVGKPPMSFQKFGRKAVDRESLSGHVALWINVGVERRPGWYPVEQFDAAQFNKPMTLGRIEPSRFGIKDDFTHVALPQNQ
jgi:hypothetical protein